MTIINVARSFIVPMLAIPIVSPTKYVITTNGINKIRESSSAAQNRSQNLAYFPGTLGWIICRASMSFGEHSIHRHAVYGTVRTMDY